MTGPARTDPLDVLGLPLDAPLPDTAPDPSFAAALRARLQQLLLRSAPIPTSGGTPMTTSTTTSAAAAAAPAAPVAGRGPAALTPYLVVADARAAVQFYVAAFGAVPRGADYVQEDGRIGHAEVLVGGALVMLADEFPESGLLGPLARGGVSTTLHLEVPDVDAVVARAVEAGGVLEREPADAPYGRTGVVRDPAGHRWMLQTPVAAADSGAGVTAARAAGGGAAGGGSVAYVTLAVPDSASARAFYGAVLGWTFSVGTVEDGWSVDGTEPAVGMGGGQARAEVQLCYRVADLRQALDAVQAGGGRAQEPEHKPYGLLAECTDPVGLRFQLWQPPAG